MKKEKKKEGEAELQITEEHHHVLQVSHPEMVSNSNKALKQKIGKLGGTEVLVSWHEGF